MNTSLRVWVLAIALPSLVGCALGMIPIPSIRDQPIDSELSPDQIRQAIKVGAAAAGWRVDEVSDSPMLATYQVRGHTVVVSIDYSTDGYSIQYMSSVNMKVRCGAEDDPTKPTKLTTGQSLCPGGAPPTYIHRTYRGWIDRLNRSIQAALQVWLS